MGYPKFSWNKKSLKATLSSFAPHCTCFFLPSFSRTVLWDSVNLSMTHYEFEPRRRRLGAGDKQQGQTNHEGAGPHFQVKDLANEENDECQQWLQQDPPKIHSKFNFLYKAFFKILYNLLKHFNEYHIEMEGGHYSEHPLCGEFALTPKKVLVSFSLATASDIL